MTLRKRLSLILAHPLTQLFVGLCMVGTGLSELVEALDGAFVSSAHGVVLYGLIQSGKALMDLLEGLEKVDERVEAKVPAE